MGAAPAVKAPKRRAGTARSTKTRAPARAPRGRAPASRARADTRTRRSSAARTSTRSGAARGSARSTAAGAQPARAPSRRRGITPPGGVAMLPVAAVGSAAGAVGGMADSGFMVGISRGRLWIGLLGVLLGGIVAVNVWGLSLSASTSATAAKIDELERSNSVQRARIAKRGSTERVEAGAAAELGLGVPAADAVRYLTHRDGAAARAAERLASGEVVVASGLVAPELPEVAGETVTAPADPAAIGTAETAPAEAATPAAPPEAEAAPATDPSAGAAAPAQPTSTPSPPPAPEPTGTAPAGGISPQG